TARALAASLAIEERDADQALLALESEGAVLRGSFESRELEWCDRRLLARIHRYTLNRLRAEIEPVTATDFLRFLFQWQPAPPTASPDSAPSSPRMEWCAPEARTTPSQDVGRWWKQQNRSTSRRRHACFCAATASSSAASPCARRTPLRGASSRACTGAWKRAARFAADGSSPACRANSSRCRRQSRECARCGARSTTKSCTSSAPPTRST